jgi:hypothetical protein
MENYQKKFYSKWEDRRLDENIAYTSELIGKKFSIDASKSEELINERLSSVKNKIKSRYENIVYYSILQEIEDELAKIVKSTYGKEYNMPLYGTVNTLEMNAKSVFIKELEDSFILFETGIFTMANLVSKIFVQTFNMNSEIKYCGLSDLNISKIILDTYLNESLSRKFCKLLIEGVSKNSPIGVKPYLISKKEHGEAIKLTTLIEVFVFSHEIGHVINGHKSCNLIKLNEIDEFEYEEIINSWEDELHADSTGLCLTLEYSKNKYNSMIYGVIAITILFNYFIMIEEIEKVLLKAEKVSTHPSAKNRLQNITELLEYHCDENVRILFKDISSRINQVQIGLFEKSKNEIFKHLGELNEKT